MAKVQILMMGIRTLGIYNSNKVLVLTNDLDNFQTTEVIYELDV